MPVNGTVPALGWADPDSYPEPDLDALAAEESELYLADMRVALIQANWAWDIGDSDGAKQHMEQAISCLECAQDCLR
jgi:hypothetical protein